MSAGAVPDLPIPTEGAGEAPAAAPEPAQELAGGNLQGSELGRHMAAIEDDYANDVAAADALYSRVNQLATATRQAAIEAATWRRDLRLYHATNQPSEVVLNDQQPEQ